MPFSKPPQALNSQSMPRLCPSPLMTNVAPQSRIQASLLLNSDYANARRQHGAGIGVLIAIDAHRHWFEARDLPRNFDEGALTWLAAITPGIAPLRPKHPAAAVPLPHSAGIQKPSVHGVVSCRFDIGAFL